jgi:hypothetical protein
MSIVVIQPAPSIKAYKVASTIQRRGCPCVVRLCHPVVALELMYEVAVSRLSAGLANPFTACSKPAGV